MKTGLAFVTLLAACGGGGGGGAVALADLGTQLSDVMCGKAFTCCTQAELSALFGSTTTLTTTMQCETYLSGLLDGFTIPQYQASVAAGRVTYDGNAAGACLDVFENDTCAQFTVDAADTAAPSGCTAFLVGQVAAGGGCTQNYECTTGYCQGVIGGMPPMDGHCMAIPTMGQACDSVCASGLYCEFATLTCQATKADGSECAMGNECTSGGCVASLCGVACPAQ